MIQHFYPFVKRTELRLCARDGLRFNQRDLHAPRWAKGSPGEKSPDANGEKEIDKEVKS
jgi:hypothetical protein